MSEQVYYDAQDDVYHFKGPSSYWMLSGKTVRAIKRGNVLELHAKRNELLGKPITYPPESKE